MTASAIRANLVGRYFHETCGDDRRGTTVSRLRTELSTSIPATRPWTEQLRHIMQSLESEFEPPNQVAFTHAERLIEQLGRLSWAPNQVVHSAEGGFAFVYEKNGRYADIECLNDGSVLAGLTDFAKDSVVMELRLEIQEIGDLRDRVERFLGARRS